ncbi:MAG: hypothetical protein MJZ84_04960 [Paludibacteraceae bacterium]|nr:hypothetical protein [Paludibacteraceae bacterium]
MKNIKFVLVAMLLACASSLFAQDLHRGDTIRILKPKDKTYLTSEKMSNWVYDINHIILQVGGKRFPKGVLVNGIYSWVDPADIELVAPCITCREEDNVDTQHLADSIAALRRARQEAQRAAEIAAADKARRDSIAAAERARRDSIAANSPSYEEIRRRQDSAFNAQLAEENRRRAYEDSIQRAVRDSIEEANAPKTIDRFTIGVRGGVASMMQDLGQVGKAKVGFDVLLDLQYAHYWPTKKQHNVGLLLGVSAAFARNNTKGPELADYMLPTIDGDVNYHIEGSVNSLVMNEVQVEVPIMFSLVTKGGFFLNVGPKLLVPVYSFYNQNLTASDITATFVKEGVSVTNDLVTGLFPSAQVNQKGQWHNAMIHVVAAGELGYEFKLKGGDSFGLGVYGGYSLFNNYKQLAQPVPSYVQISAPSATSTAVVDVKCASDVHANKLGYWDAGLKLAYHFNWYHKPHKK